MKTTSPWSRMTFFLTGLEYFINCSVYFALMVIWHKWKRKLWMFHEKTLMNSLSAFMTENPFTPCDVWAVRQIMGCKICGVWRGYVACSQCTVSYLSGSVKRVNVFFCSLHFFSQVLIWTLACMKCSYKLPYFNYILQITWKSLQGIVWSCYT